MYLVVIGFQNGDVDYCGPFPTRTRAEQYGRAAQHDYMTERRVKIRWHTVPMSVPYSVVKDIVWR